MQQSTSCSPRNKLAHADGRGHQSDHHGLYQRTPRFLVFCILTGLLGCGEAGAPGSAEKPGDRNDLSAMQKARIQVKGHTFEVWLAKTTGEQELGLMRTTEDKLETLPDGTQRGMLFVFANERPLAFWMMNTIIPLDIIYIRADGRIVKKYTMAPLETRLYPSVEPALYALEMRAGLLDTLGVGPGDLVEIPESVLKSPS
jgi:uncharacterized protein